ncbi:MAG TPA: serine/threonine-protein kinase [Thermoanaerobaculia bacterium]|nr:serine/threonine-protein kinase [Thermoanaerobaculia bacterium]
MPFFCIHCKSEIDSRYKACPFCGEAITDFLRRYLETPLDGKYRILSRLGVGGMGEVYKVLHTHLNAVRVIKLMRSNIAADAGAHERFLREARLATKIQHPNVAALFDFSTLEDGSHYMVWEYIEGINLHELITERGPLSARYAATLAAQALHGLEAIHRAGIVHRDVSPENLMIARDDEGLERVKIIDLGIAKSASSADDNKTKTGMFVGKWKYCSPEHLGMLPPGERIDGRADLYSFGIVMYEMLTGVPPFVCDTPHAYLMKHASEQPKPLREVNPSAVVPPQLEALIFRALEKDRAKRYASAREFAQELERVAATLPDTPGALPPLPAAAEVTGEATNVGYDGNAETVVSLETQARGGGFERGVARDPLPVARDPLSGDGPRAMGHGQRRSAWLYVAAVVLALVGAGGWMVWRERPVPSPPRVVNQPLKASVVVTPVTQGRIAVNAFPWANVTSVRNADSGVPVDVGAGVVTPAPLDLPPGRYEVTLANPNFPRPITRTVDVPSGGNVDLHVTFSDPAGASVPDFGAGE